MRAIVLVVFIGCLILAFLPIAMESEPEMQYYQAKCIDHKEHRVCKAEDQLIYFNFTGQSNLTETEIDSLANEL